MDARLTFRVSVYLSARANSAAPIFLQLAAPMASSRGRHHTEPAPTREMELTSVSTWDTRFRFYMGHATSLSTCVRINALSFRKARTVDGKKSCTSPARPHLRAVGTHARNGHRTTTHARHGTRLRFYTGHVTSLSTCVRINALSFRKTRLRRLSFRKTRTVYGKSCTSRARPPRDPRT